jgi:hypothetical protein
VSAAEEVNDRPAGDTATAANAGEPRCCLFDERMDFPASCCWTEADRGAERGDGGRLEIYREFMARDSRPAARGGIATTSGEICRRRIDVIVAAMGPSLDFLVNGVRAFHGVPSSRRHRPARDRRPEPGATSPAFSSAASSPTLEIALGLHPGPSRRLLGGAAAAKYWEERAG